MSNTLVTIDMITREALRIAHEKCQFIGTVDRQYDDSFGKTGAKIGTTLRVRKPNKYVRTTGSRVMDVQDQNESKVDVTVATQDHVDMRFNSAELALSIDEISKRYIEPAVAVLVSGIEADFLSYAMKQTYNMVGTAGTAITTLITPGQARARLNGMLAPKDQRAVQMDSVSMASLVGTTLAGYQNPSSDLSAQYREGLIARTAMADFYENERCSLYAGGSDHTTVTVNASSGATDGGTTITISGGNTSIGSTFTVAGVYACHPETKASLGYLQSFVVTGGTMTGALTVSPATYWTGANKNVCTSTGGDVAVTTFNSAVATFTGGDSKNYNQALMYHPEAFTFVTADLPLMGDAASCARRTQDGLSMRVWQASDIRNDELLMRIDMLYGMAAIRPQWACRMIGAEAV